MWVSPIFEPSLAFLFGSLDFIVDRLGVLHLCEEALVPAPIVGGAPSDGSGPPDNLNDEAPVLRSEPTLGSNPAASNVHIVIYSLFTIFHQLFGGTPLSSLRPPSNQFPYDLASPANAYARVRQRMLAPLPLTSEFVGMASYAPASFHNLIDDEVESDGSSIGDVVAPSQPLS